MARQQVVTIGLHPAMVDRIKRVLHYFPDLSRSRLVANALEVELSRLEGQIPNEGRRITLDQAVAAARNLVRS